MTFIDFLHNSDQKLAPFVKFNAYSFEKKRKIFAIKNCAYLKELTKWKTFLCVKKVSQNLGQQVFTSSMLHAIDYEVAVR